MGKQYWSHDMNQPTYQLIRKRGLAIQQLSLISGIPASSLYAYCRGAQPISEEDGKLIDHLLEYKEGTFSDAQYFLRNRLTAQARSILANIDD
jgi:predicted transcriptional regulator